MMIFLTLLTSILISATFSYSVWSYTQKTSQALTTTHPALFWFWKTYAVVIPILTIGHHVSQAFGFGELTPWLMVLACVMSAIALATLPVVKKMRSSKAWSILFDALEDAIIITDASFRVLFFNEAASRLYGIPKDKILGNAMSDFINATDISWDKDAAIATLYRDGFWRGQVEHETSSTTIHMLSTVSLVKSSKGETVGVVAINRPIHDIVTAQMALEDEVRRQTSDLLQANAQLRRFAHTISHDLQAPLRHMSLYSSALIEDMQDTGVSMTPDMQESILHINKAFQKGTDLIHGALEFASAEKVQAKTVPTDIGEVMRDCLTTNGLDLENAHVSGVGSSSWPKVIGDHGLILRIFNNLIENAIKFQHKDRPLALTISTRQDEQHLHVSIQDNGRGFSPERNEEIFTEFGGRQFHDVKGAGVGLATCRILASKIKGTLTAQGSSQGACFTLTLPLCIESQND